MQNTMVGWGRGEIAAGEKIKNKDLGQKKEKG